MGKISQYPLSACRLAGGAGRHWLLRRNPLIESDIVRSSCCREEGEMQRAYRWLMGTQGTALDVPGACQIRHVVKGRYKKDSFISTIRAYIRKSQRR